MSEYPRLAEVVGHHTPSGAEGIVNCWCQRQFTTFREHANHVAEVWREACTIRTVEQLDALPIGATVMALWTKMNPAPVATRYMDGWFGFLGGGQPMEPLGPGAFGPALLLWHPGWEVPNVR